MAPRGTLLNRCSSSALTATTRYAAATGEVGDGTGGSVGCGTVIDPTRGARTAGTSSGAGRAPAPVSDPPCSLHR